MISSNGHRNGIVNRIFGGGPGSGPQGGKGDTDNGPSYVGHASKNVSIKSSGQIKLKAPKTAAEADEMMGSMIAISDAALADFAAAATLPPNSLARVNASLRLAHVNAQMSRAASMSRAFVS